MANVKPGDIARIVAMPAPCLERNVGAQVLVERQIAQQDLPLYMRLGGIGSSGPVWEVEALEPLHVTKGPYGRRTSHAEPGTKGIIVEDKYLRRIDPPEEDEGIHESKPVEDLVTV